MCWRGDPKLFIASPLLQTPKTQPQPLKCRSPFLLTVTKSGSLTTKRGPILLYKHLQALNRISDVSYGRSFNQKYHPVWGSLSPSYFSIPQSSVLLKAPISGGLVACLSTLRSGQSNLGHCAGGSGLFHFAGLATQYILQPCALTCHRPSFQNSNLEQSSHGRDAFIAKKHWAAAAAHEAMQQHPRSWRN